MANYKRKSTNKKEEYVKRSGATYSKISDTKSKYVGKTIVSAWNVSKQKGLITCTVAPYKGSEVFVGKKLGNEYQKMIAKVFYHNSGIEKLIPCNMNTKTRVIGLESIRMCISPNGSGHTSSGKRVTGYFGTYIERKN